MQAARCTPSRVSIIFLLGPYEAMCEILHALSRSLLEQMTWWGWMSPCGYHCSTSSKLLLPRGSELSKLGKCHPRGWRNGWRAAAGTLHKPAGTWVCLVTSHWEMDPEKSGCAPDKPPSLQSPNKGFAAEELPSLPSLPFPMNHPSVIWCGAYS